MIRVFKRESDFDSRKDYLIHVALLFIRRNSGVSDRIMYDEAVCDGYSLANDLEIEFEMEREAKRFES